MSKEEIHQALRLLGRGFINHPQVEQLAEKLELMLHFYEESAKTVASIPEFEPMDIEEAAALYGQVMPAPAKRTRKAKAD